ncbi:hypothetical protein [Kitasatospora purpeofusca]|uniref:hypothetical protein n=1 Tax=Kitasatospora purpeofusca TaxID=67352 RepID=UPI003F4A9C10
MASDRDLRIAAGFTLARMLAEPQTQKMFRDNGYASDRQIVIALESDTLQAIYSKLQRYDPPVLVAIYWPETKVLRFTQMEPSERLDDYSPDRDDVRGASTIGMLWEHTAQQHHGQFRFRLQWGESTLRVMPFAAASR